ncbi:MAG: hypothetical protein ACRDVZ_13095, partial [Jiangellaceae bacterium]
DSHRPDQRAASVIGYLDTSAFVPLLVAEPSSESCRRFWHDADAVVTRPSARSCSSFVGCPTETIRATGRP